MKRHIIAASCVVLAATVLSSCQKEDKSVVDLANELTAELQQVTDPATANAHAARVKVLNQRLQNASVRVLALNDTALLRGAGADEAAPGSDYAKALSELAREVGRVRASYPAAADEEPDNAKLLIAIAAAQGKEGTADELKEAGENYMKDENNPHDVPGDFPEYYGSDALKDALAYKANAAEVSNLKFDSAEDVPAVPEVSKVAADSSESSSGSGAAAEPSEKPAADGDSGAEAFDSEEEDDGF